MNRPHNESSSVSMHIACIKSRLNTLLSYKNDSKLNLVQTKIKMPQTCNITTLEQKKMPQTNIPWTLVTMITSYLIKVASNIRKSLLETY